MYRYIFCKARKQIIFIMVPYQYVQYVEWRTLLKKLWNEYVLRIHFINRPVEVASRVTHLEGVIFCTVPTYCIPFLRTFFPIYKVFSEGEVFQEGGPNNL
jgi:hypothetical protein